MLEVGTQVPDFCLPNQDEEEICFRDIKGRWIVLYFYPKDNTPGCTTEACDFTAALPDFTDLDAIILGVSPDSPEKHRKFIEKKDKVKVTVIFRGREITLSSLGRDVLQRMAEELEDIAVVEQYPKFEGRTMFMILAAKAT